MLWLCAAYSDGDVMKHTPAINDTVSTARWLAVGGRGVDTAWSYDHGGYGHSQRQMGLAIHNFTSVTGTARSEIFVTTKIPCGTNSSGVAAMIKYDLDQLMLSYVDLLIIHTPATCKTSADTQVTWEGMQAALAANLTRAIGLSNFKPTQIDALLANAGTKIVPAVNQCGLHVGYHDDATISYCAKHGITYQSYSALGPSITNYKSKWRNIWIRDVFCYRIPAPLVPGVPTKTRLESSIKKF